MICLARERKLLRKSTSVDRHHLAGDRHSSKSANRRILMKFQELKLFPKFSIFTKDPRTCLNPICICFLSHCGSYAFILDFLLGLEKIEELLLSSLGTPLIFLLIYMTSICPMFFVSSIMSE